MLTSKGRKAARYDELYELPHNLLKSKLIEIMLIPF